MTKNKLFAWAIILLCFSLTSCSDEKDGPSEKILVTNAGVTEANQTVKPGDIVHIYGDGFQEGDQVDFDFRWDIGEPLFPEGYLGPVGAEIVERHSNGMSIRMPYRKPESRVEIFLNRASERMSLGKVLLADGQTPKDFRLYGINETDKTIERAYAEETVTGKKTWDMSAHPDFRSVVNLQKTYGLCGLAEENGVVLAEAMTIYHMPLYKKLQEVIQSGKLGKLCMAQMNFGSYKEYDMQNRFFNPNLAGGALLDIGVYAISFIRSFMSCTPDQVVSQVKFAPSGVDEQAGILLMNPAREMATIALTLHAKQPKRGMLAFENGYVEIYYYPRAEKAVITYTEDASQEVIECGSTKDALWYEVNDMEEAVSGAADEMHFDYTVDVMNVMTEIRKAWGLSYPEERESL